MKSKLTIEYIDNDLLVKKLKCNSNFIPHKGEEIWIDDECYVVNEITAYFYTVRCQDDKIRVFINKKD
jgi:hypothetical protein